LYSSLSALLCLRILALFDTLWTLLTVDYVDYYINYPDVVINTPPK